ncbi:MAG TPA: hypothetical protein VJ749_18320 [Pyrinomonadaceae bacterium]|nr:hypothetical protein [Pyrinomonadaceae bacterium]
MRSSRIILATLVASSLLTTACLKEVAKSLTEVRRVQQTLTKEFGDQVFVSINEQSNHLLLNVSFINSALNGRSGEERAARAQRTAEIIKLTYPRINSVDAIWVAFVRQESHYVFFHQSEMFDYFGFRKDGKRFTSRSDPEVVNGSGVQLEVTATYSSNSDESDVLVSGIQLEGEPGGLGLTVLPHFKVAGNVRSEQKRPPATVSFDFASYSEKPRYKQTEPITFLADKKPVLQMDGRFTGNDAQFCYLPVPYAAFSKMIAAQELSIKLGGKEYALKPAEFAAIQRMAEYVK